MPRFFPPRSCRSLLRTTFAKGSGFESGIDKRFSDAPVFYWLYTLLIGGGAALVLIPHFPLLKMMLYSQVVNGILLPFVVIYMLLLINRPRLMGEFRNKPLAKRVAWTTAIAIIIIAIIWVVTTLTA